jgi:aldehyde:ferredoxin oxidoreductase
VPWFSRSSMGGDMGHHLKYAGYDGLIIVGRASRPVYLRIDDDDVALCDAGDLWGQGIMASQSALRQRLGRGVQIAVIGPAGETLSCIATIGTNEGSAAGQCGFGAVMGAKRLKAVAVRGSGRPRVAHPEAFRAIARAIAQEHVQDMRRRPSRGGRPDLYGARVHRCSTGCIMGCATRYEQVPGVLRPDRRYEGVVQCTAGRFRGAAGHYWDLGFEAGFELNMAANDWGINHWDLMKGLFPWIGMCHRAGLLPDIGGRPVELNEPAFWWDVLESIATRCGPMAEIVADGGWRAIQRTGLLPDEARELYTGWGYANHWDGRGPRGNQISYPFWLVSALLWMVDTRDPMGSAHGYVQDMLRVSPFGSQILSWEQLQGIGRRLYGRAEAMDPLSDYEGKAEAAVWHARRSMLKGSLPLCDRIFPRLFTSLTDDGLPRAGGVEGPEFEYHLYALATGHDVGVEGLDALAERALDLERAQQVRDFGRTRDTEVCVLRYFCDTPEEYSNPLLGERRRAEIGPLTALADEFYRLRGWDVSTGIPTRERLDALGLTHVAPNLPTGRDEGEMT